MYVYERYLGHKLDYFLFMDDDIDLFCIPVSPTNKTDLLLNQSYSVSNTDPNVGRKCWNYLWDEVMKWKLAYAHVPWPAVPSPEPLNFMGMVDA
jgi:hypothetical protein